MDCYDKAIRKIEHDKKCKPKCLAMIGPTHTVKSVIKK